MSNETKWTIEYDSEYCEYEVVLNKSDKPLFKTIYSEIAYEVCTELNRLESEVERLQSELARFKEERLGAEEIKPFLIWNATPRMEHTKDAITAFRKSQEGSK